MNSDPVDGGDGADSRKIERAGISIKTNPLPLASRVVSQVERSIKTRRPITPVKLS
jgi:hypothetical protein